MFITEIIAMLFALSGSYFLENKTFLYRFLSNTSFGVANILTIIVSLSHSMFGITLLQVIFIYFTMLGFKSLNNDLMREKDKNIFKFFFNIDINFNFQIKDRYFFLVLFPTFLIIAFLYDSEFYTKFKALELIGLFFAIYGVYTINKGFLLDTKYVPNTANLITGIFVGFFFADIFLLITAIDGGMYPFAFQTFVFIIVSIKNLYFLLKPLKDRNLVTVIIKDYLPNAKYYFNFK